MVYFGNLTPGITLLREGGREAGGGGGEGVQFKTGEPGYWKKIFTGYCKWKNSNVFRII